MRKLLTWNNRVQWFKANGLPYGPKNILLNQKNRFVKRFFLCIIFWFFLAFWLLLWLFHHL